MQIYDTPKSRASKVLGLSSWQQNTRCVYSTVPPTTMDTREGKLARGVGTEDTDYYPFPKGSSIFSDGSCKS